MKLDSALKLERRLRPAIVWSLRVVIGAIFVMSGLAKCFDIWGFVYKIEEYLLVWDWMQPRSLVVCGALSLSVMELLCGVMMITGSLRRITVWLMLAMMAVMLPLTVYIYVASPVNDCGCFGDMVVISNGATLLKNIVITLALIYLLFFNRSVNGLYSVPAQWWVGLITVVTGAWIGLYGFNVQPMADFRSFPIGSSLCPSYCDGVNENDYRFIYELDGEQREFSVAELPDSTWTFVDRIDLNSGATHDATLMTIYDGDEEVTEDVVCTDEAMLMVIIPQRSRADLSYTYIINELQRVASQCGARFVELVDLESPEGVESWRDLTMADCDIFTAESTVLKELSRGIASAVYVSGGAVQWKRNLASVDVTALGKIDADVSVNDICRHMNPDTSFWLRSTLITWVSLMVIMLAVDRVVRSSRRKNKETADGKKTSLPSDATKK